MQIPQLLTHGKLKNPGARVLLGLVVAIGLIIWISPFVLSLYHQTQGGLLIDQVLSLSKNTSLEPIACDLLLEQNAQSEAKVQKAIHFLQKAKEYDSDSAHTYLLLGRAYCLQGKLIEAVDAYQIYTNLRPANPLGHLELGFAYEAQCRMDANKELSAPDPWCEDDGIRAQIKDEWEKAGVVVGQFLTEANQAFTKERYRDAVRWYRRSATFTKWTDSANYFLWNTAAAATGQALPTIPDFEPVEIQPLTATVQIMGDHLYFLPPSLSLNLPVGKKFHDLPGARESIASMWWAGAASVFVDVPEDSLYQITFRVNAQGTAPLQGSLLLEVKRDMLTIEQFDLTEKTGGWNSLEAATRLTPGLHLVSFHFPEDNGDIFINWVLFQKLAASQSQ